MNDERSTAIIEAARQRRIRVMKTAGLPHFQGISLAMSVFDLERFLDSVSPPPITGDDPLALRIIGRPGDLGIEDEPWQFEIVPGFSDAGFEMRAIVNIPDQDVAEVALRLNEGRTT